MDVEALYQQTIDDLKQEKRPLHKFNEQDFREIFTYFANAYQEEDFQKIEKALCLLDHGQNSHEMFEGILCKLLHHPKATTDQIVFSLCATQRHIIQRRNYLGEKYPPYYLESIRKLLETQDPEVKEWTLRTIDEMGNQGKQLVHDVLRTRPKFLKMLNRHHRNSHEIIEMLMLKWGLKKV